MGILGIGGAGSCNGRGMLLRVEGIEGSFIIIMPRFKAFVRPGFLATAVLALGTPKSSAAPRTEGGAGSLAS